MCQKIIYKVFIVISYSLITCSFVLKSKFIGDKSSINYFEPKYAAISGSCDKLAQPYIDQGLNWFYGFQFANALISFEAALEKDERCVQQALWGIALNAKGNPNSRYLAFKDDPKKEGLKAIKKAIDMKSDTNKLTKELVDALK